MLKELETYGYLARHKRQRPDGKWTSETEVFEQPLKEPETAKPDTENPDTVYPTTGKPDTENPTTNQRRMGATTDEKTTETKTTDVCAKPVAGARDTHTPFHSEKPRRERVRATGIPDDFAPTPDMLAGARAKYPTMDIEAASAHWINNVRANTSKYQYTDWNQAWWNGMANAEEWGWNRLDPRRLAAEREAALDAERPPKDHSWAKDENGMWKHLGPDPVTGLLPWPDLSEYDNRRYEASLWYEYLQAQKAKR
jgi:hypothetical protein